MVAGLSSSVPVEQSMRSRRVAPLDGVRGLALVAVLLFHGGVTQARGGFLGVDLFFVLSGYLITDLLLARPIDLERFAVRRARRLVPALVVVVAAIGLAAQIGWGGADRTAWARDALSALGYVSNWRFALTGTGYFDETVVASPLLHTWTLGVEAQFYVVWSVVVMAVRRRRRNAARLVRTLAVAAVLASWAAAMLSAGDGAPSPRSYYGTDTRAHAIFVGAALAAALRVRSGAHDRRSTATWSAPVLAPVVSAASLLALLVVWMTVDGQSPWWGHGGMVLVDLAGVGLIGGVVLAPEGPVGRLLSLRPLVALGLVSYSAYLWHWPIDLVLNNARTGLSGAALLGARLVVTGVFGTLSWALVERTFQRQLLPDRRVLALAAAAVVLVLSLVGPLAAGSGRGPDAVAATSPDVSDTLVRRAADPPASAPSTSPRSTVAPATSTPTTLDPARPLKAVVLGDSVAMTVVQPIGRLASERGIELVDASTLGCGVARGGPYRYFGSVKDQTAGCDDWPNRWRGVIDAERPDVVVIVVGRWEVMDRTLDGDYRHVGEPAFDDALRQELRTAIDVASGGGTRVLVTTAPYYLRGERPDGGRWPEDDPARVDRFNVLLREAAADAGPGVAVFDLNAVLGPDGQYTRDIGGVEVRYDGVHLTGAGARLVAPGLFDTIRSIANAPA